MNIFPAIDLRGGRVVRLVQGDYDKMTIYSEDPVEMAEQFKNQGAENLHVVDLDGAKDGVPVNFEIISKIVGQTGLFVQVGGGIRNEKRIRQYLDIGVNRVILGTAASKDPSFLKQMILSYGHKIAVSVDVKNGLMATDGWTETTNQSGIDFCYSLQSIGVKTVIYTDISKDGGLSGTNIEAYKQLSQIKGLDIIASGGISSEEEISTLKEITHGAILGKAIYDGLLNLTEVIKLARC